MTSTSKKTSPSAEAKVCRPSKLRSTSGRSAQMRYEEMAFERSYTASVKRSSAGPPFSTLYLMPKSFSGPPGLCDAVRRMPP